MLLQRLVEFQRPEIPGVEGLPPFFQIRPMRWGLMINTDGRLAAPELLDLSDPTNPKSRFGMPCPVPYLARAAGISPLLGADDIQYVLGWVDEASKNPDRVARCHAGFVDLIHRWAAAFPTDPVAVAVAGFFTRRGYAGLRRPPEWTSKHGVILLVGDDSHPLPDEPSVRTYWEVEVERRKAGGSGNDGARRGICLVCGQPGVLVDRLPQQLPRRLVPQASQASAALVSANKRIHTFDFTENLTTVPICLGCARQSVANLHYLLDDPDHALSGRDSRMTWWTIGGTFDVGLLSTATPADVRVLVERVHTGGGIGADLERARFCSVTISGSGARVVVRDWVDMPLAQLEENITGWFTDHQMFGVDSSRDGYQPLLRLELATGRWIKRPAGDGRAGEYARFDDTSAQRPDDVRRQLFHTAIKGLPLPPSLFGHLLTRIRTDGHIDAARAALLRLALVRRHRLRHPDRKDDAMPGPGLDLHNHDPAYLAGRIFAQLEAIQYYAAGVGKAKDARLNTTFTDRYLAGAIANPKIALVQGRKLAQPWLKKIGRGRPDQAVALGRQLSDLFAMFDAQPGLPGRAHLDAQAMFILGYDHHRTDSIRRGRDANAAKALAAAASATSATPVAPAVPVQAAPDNTVEADRPPAV